MYIVHIICDYKWDPVRLDGWGEQVDARFMAILSHTVFIESLSGCASAHPDWCVTAVSPGGDEAILYTACLPQSADGQNSDKKKRKKQIDVLGRCALPQFTVL